MAIRHEAKNLLEHKAILAANVLLPTARNSQLTRIDIHERNHSPQALPSGEYSGTFRTRGRG